MAEKPNLAGNGYNMQMIKSLNLSSYCDNQNQMYLHVVEPCYMWIFRKA